MSDERDAGTESGAPTGDGDGDTRSQTAVVTGPLRPTGKRSRRGAAVVETDDTDTGPETDASGAKDDGDGPRSKRKKKTAKKPKDGPSRNPFTFVFNYLAEVIGELRKVIWPNRKQMVTYTTVVLLFLAFMVAMIGLADLGLAKLVSIIFG
ncbi:preprotein translocase subunit SecE [Mycolicibacterium duvalii]|uniref:Protein translocase subunit SecE n=1 Tax=Mycolicibacterium duvalii TaxID=39688 RepID=A0A7I7K3H8_9MYCO|nr:preprotein translocase subunit SecE [Mycolicibacterium duvalii]MCV7367797.1 preprotein translocase subunit SecE [Mycolicibacterium duvalii]BBX18613.1 protein translocase subunit SecE [Mycolicibacterium duvalii]